MSIDQWEAVIGLEIHVQLKTESKIFSGSSIAYGADPNRQASAIDLGMPGTLPVLNAEAVRMAVAFGLSIGAEIAPSCVFARKNYFYPDLPKGYQISQYEAPIVAGGTLDIVADNEARSIRVTRAHLEEDAGKSIHDLFRGHTAIDLNRAGTALLEVVSEPDMHTPAEAVAYMKAMHTLVRSLDLCDGNLQEGSFRCDANVSVRPKGSTTLGTRAEIKNMNSFRFVERAIDHEIHRQVHRLESGKAVVQETRLYDSDKNETRSMRSKEEAEDYRYFPDPDLLPVTVDELLIDEIRVQMPELPKARRARYESELKLGAEEALQLTDDPELVAYFEATLEAGTELPPKRVANWILGELQGALNRADLTMENAPVSPSQLAELLGRIEDGTLSGKLGKQVFEGLFAGEGEVDAIIEARGLRQISDSSAIEAVIDEVIASSPDQVAQYRGGEAKVFNYFVGQVMKATRGQANPGQVQKTLKEKLDS
ncbi:MAG: Asp-tRNA(Asn)/Glu-tRNA(Gln) amidotransferase subunit GatB [Pseudomonadota bacterium]